MLQHPGALNECQVLVHLDLFARKPWHCCCTLRYRIARHFFKYLQVHASSIYIDFFSFCCCCLFRPFFMKITVQKARLGYNLYGLLLSAFFLQLVSFSRKYLGPFFPAIQAGDPHFRFCLMISLLCPCRCSSSVTLLLKNTLLRENILFSNKLQYQQATSAKKRTYNNNYRTRPVTKI